MKAMVPVIRYVRPVRPVDFPSTGPEWEMVQSGPHMRLCDALDAIVRAELRGRACVGKDQLVYFDGADTQRCCAPDLLVRLDTPPRTFKSWKTWEDGTPDLCVEVLSPSDHEKHGLEEKLERYRAMGLPELVAFAPDAPRGERLRAWDRVEGDLVERIVDHERTPWRALGLWLVVAPVLDDVLPPRFGVVVPGDLGQLAERVDPAEAVVVGGGERMGQRQVDAANRNASFLGPPHGLPFGAERREREERGASRLVRDIAEQRHRGPGRGGKAEHLLRLSRRFDQDDVGHDPVESAHHRPGRAGTVVPDAQQLDMMRAAHALTPSATSRSPAHPLTSRQAT